MKNNKKSLQAATAFAEELAILAGAKLLHFQKKLAKLKIVEKKAQGVASTADIESEKLIIDKIKAQFPETEILAEEMFFNLKNSEEIDYVNTEWLWVIDPLDGTNNYLNRLDYYAVCISLLYFGKPVMGVVYRPENGEMFSATKNCGAYYKKREQRKVKLSSMQNNKKLKNSLLATGFVSEKGHFFNLEFDSFLKLMKKSRGVRRMGSAALDLCYVALGVFDGFWERGLAPWDLSAAGFICLEAGVKVTDYTGVEFSPFAATVIAARSGLYRELKKQMPKID